MGHKKTLDSYSLITDGVMTGTTTLTSPPTYIANLDNIGLQVGWTGTPTGTVSVLVSPDDVNYDALTFDPALTQPSGSASRYWINISQLASFYIKVQYVNASGTGVLNVKICGKDLN